MNKVVHLVFYLFFATAPALAFGEGGCSLSHKNKATQDETVEQLLSSDSTDRWFQKMNDSLLIRIFSFFLGLLLILSTAAVNADELVSSLLESDPTETVQAPRQMTEKQMNDLFGEDPYLGQTSYLQSPDSFSQREKWK